MALPMKKSGKGATMASGGFLVKFDGKEIKRCYAVSFDYDRGQYRLNDDPPLELPVQVKKITVEVEKGEFPD